MLQIFLGIMFIRIDIGYDILSWITKEISIIRRYSDFGTFAVFGDYYDKYKTVLKVLPSIIFFIIIFKILQYYNLIQAVLVGIGYLSHIIMGTTVCESVYNFLNTFLGWIVCCIIIQPYFHLLTNSELHAVMTGNFGILSGTIIAAFLDLVFDANHVLAASVISAPASLIVSKILYPETELSSTNIQNIYIIKNKYVHIVDAITDGIEIGLKLYIIAAINLIAFTALIAMLDAFLQTLCKLADMEPLSTDVLLAYLFIPFTWLIGIEVNDCYNVAHLISLKTIYSEINAMKILRDLKRTFTLSNRSHCISLYAICSFSNLINMGTQLGSFYIMSPDRYPAITSLVASAFVGGMISSFLTACIAGFVIDDDDLKKSSIHVIG